MSPAEELARHLADAGITGAFGGADAWSVHCSAEPLEPENCVTVYDSGGLDPLVIGGADMEQPQVQVRVRSKDYNAAWELQKLIRRELVQPDLVATPGAPLERDIGGGRYVQIVPLAAILSIGRDENDRAIVVANYQLIRQELEDS